MIALVQQATHSTIGFANPTLYAIDRVLPAAFRDVQAAEPAGRAGVHQQGQRQQLPRHAGPRHLAGDDAVKYDDVTGIGGVSFQLLTLLGQGRH